MPLSPVIEKIVLHWGEMGARWGVNRSVAQIHALLWLTGRPMSAEEIAETLGIARSNVSTSLDELQTYRLVTLVHVIGDRRNFYESKGDTWDIVQTIVDERKKREIDPTLEVLRAARDLDDDRNPARRAPPRRRNAVVHRTHDRLVRADAPRAAPDACSASSSSAAGIVRLISQVTAESRPWRGALPNWMWSGPRPLAEADDADTSDTIARILGARAWLSLPRPCAPASRA